MQLRATQTRSGSNMLLWARRVYTVFQKTATLFFGHNFGK